MRVCAYTIVLFGRAGARARSFPVCAHNGHRKSAGAPGLDTVAPENRRRHCLPPSVVSPPRSYDPDEACRARANLDSEYIYIYVYRRVVVWGRIAKDIVFLGLRKQATKTGLTARVQLCSSCHRPDVLTVSTNRTR